MGTLIVHIKDVLNKNKKPFTGSLTSVTRTSLMWKQRRLYFTLTTIVFSDVDLKCEVFIQLTIFRKYIYNFVKVFWVFIK